VNLEDAIDGLLTMADALFPQGDPSVVRTPEENLDAIRGAIEDLFNRHDLPENIKLSDPRMRSSKTKV
jgi:hypothetical protein